MKKYRWMGGGGVIGLCVPRPPPPPPPPYNFREGDCPPKILKINSREKSRKGIKKKSSKIVYVGNKSTKNDEFSWV